MTYHSLGATPWSDVTACPARLAKVLNCLDDPNSRTNCDSILGPSYKPNVEHYCNDDKVLERPAIPDCLDAGALASRQFCATNPTGPACAPITQSMPNWWAEYLAVPTCGLLEMPECLPADVKATAQQACRPAARAIVMAAPYDQWDPCDLAELPVCELPEGEKGEKKGMSTGSILLLLLLGGGTLYWLSQRKKGGAAPKRRRNPSRFVRAGTARGPRGYERGRRFVLRTEAQRRRRRRTRAAAVAAFRRSGK